MKTWLRCGVTAVVLCAALSVGAGFVLANQADTVRKATKTKAKPAVPASKTDAKVDTFVDQNNDGVDDRRERKVVRPESSRRSLQSTTERSPAPAVQSKATTSNAKPVPSEPEEKKKEKKPPQ